MTPVPCYRATHLHPSVEFFRGIGAAVEHGLRQAGLPTIIIDEPGIYLPNQRTIDFLKQLSHREGIDESPLRTLQRRLKKSAVTYSDLITELRYERAARLLRESDSADSSKAEH